jgi:hypothetical protein
MDEEDGRPGALAAQTGQPDALMDVLPLSLRLKQHAKLTNTSASPRFSGPSHRPAGEHRSGRTLQGEPPFKPQLQRPKAVGLTAGGGEQR